MNLTVGIVNLKKEGRRRESVSGWRSCLRWVVGSDGPASAVSWDWLAKGTWDGQAIILALATVASERWRELYSLPLQLTASDIQQSHWKARALEQWRRYRVVMV
jgi:hypothetical protein